MSPLPKQHRRHKKGTRGVSYRESRNRWVATIYDGEKSVYIGSYRTEAEAIEAYDQKCRELFGERALVNDGMRKSAEVVSMNGTSCRVCLKDGTVVTVDKDDLDTVLEHAWYRTAQGQIVASIDRGLKSLHRVVMNEPEGSVVRLGGKYDFRKSSLRVDESHSYMTRVSTKSRRSRYKGVVVRSDGAIVVFVKRRDGVSRYVGSFPSEEDAARAYDAEVRKLYGDLAETNEDLGLL